jgi:tetratricopeptide (TPR) repeat protein
MKRSSLTLAALIALILLVTLSGFQCGSSEMTTAKLAYSQHNLEKADSSFMKEVEKNPTNAEAWYFLGRVRLERGNYAGMAEAFKQSLSVSQEFAPKINDDKKYAWGQSLNDGVTAYNKYVTISKDPAAKDSAAPYLQKAVTAYKLALAINPDSLITYRNLAVAEHLSGNFDEEIGYLQKALAIRKDPQISSSLINAYIQKAEDAKKSGKTAEATESFDKAIAAMTEQRAANPSDDELMGTMINVYIDAGRAKDALPLIKEAVTKDPKNKVYQNDLGLLLFNQENYEEAIQHFDAAVAADSMFEDALRNGAVASMKLGAKMKEAADAKSKGKAAVDKAYVDKFKHAVVLLEKLTSLKPNNPDFFEALASAYGNAGMFKQAEAALKKVDALKGK